MQANSRVPGGAQASVKIYNAVYSSVQVYECMVRGIAVMRRRNDSYVNATQILKVAGVDKGRRTKILEKEILPGKHEIVQGGYGKYQGTWIPLERGRDIAFQYGVAPLLAPLFDFTPSNSLGTMSSNNPQGPASPRPLSASSSYSSVGQSGSYVPSIPSTLAPPPIMPGSALRLLNQGRAQGLFTPSTSDAQASFSPHSSTPPPHNSSLKRNRSEADVDILNASAHNSSHNFIATRPNSAAILSAHEEGPSPAKRLRRDGSPHHVSWHVPTRTTGGSQNTIRDSSQPGSANLSRTSTVQSLTNGADGKDGTNLPELESYNPRYASKPLIARPLDPFTGVKEIRRKALLQSLSQRDEPDIVLTLLRELTPDYLHNHPSPLEADLVLDDQGHTALHVAASFARLQSVEALLASGADIHRGNYLGETPLIRACIATHNADQQTFQNLVPIFHSSIRTLDTSRKSVIHHIVSLAGVKGRAVAARYYLDQIFFWIAQHQAGDFKSLVDLQDDNGDTALNIAARVGNRSLVRTLLDVGANRVLPNKLGLRPGDFGVEVEELSSGLRAEDILAGLRSGPPAPVQKSQDVISDITNMVQSLSTEFQGEIKSKQDALDVTQAHLRAATRELSEQRKQIQLWQSRCAELDQINQRVRNVEKALVDEDQFDWTGRTQLDGSDAKVKAGQSFALRGSNSTMVGVGGAVDVSFSVDVEPPLPTVDSVGCLVKLRRMKMWYDRMEELMNERLEGLRGASAEKEYQCKKIVALCTGIPIDKVEEMLENLVIAVESESQIVDIGRVSGFMQKVRDGII
ncbi:transcription factor [Pluteus cervinus]|uniref:Transcription factor n=1 Tax=Pluteus cervinus TaxID=181527 RepID=A0ACD3AIX3_9AGAR|nr:transcription factor [Pluteus cervinus]